jgi:uncharacterized protein Yka (UPF0111/DUF47 family)
MKTELLFELFQDLVAYVARIADALERIADRLEKRPI